MSAAPRPADGGFPGATGLLRVYTLAGDIGVGGSLAAAIVAEAGRAGLRGASVFPAIAGFGRNSYEPELNVEVFHPERQPLIVEVVDAYEALVAFLPTLTELNTPARMVTMERVRVYGDGPAPGS